MIRGFLKLLTRLFALLLAVLIVIGAYFAVQGYGMYRDAVEAVPIAEKVAEIEGMTHYIPYEELPDFYIAAVIAAEDQRFESHPGIDPIAIVRAVWTDLKAGALVEGGSTITQQLAKNLYFTQEKKFERKFAEIFTAFAFERECSKQEIFALYVNTIYFGSGYYGIDAAAEGYFQKTPAELNDWECAMLAGLPNAPSAYALDAHPDLARQRLNQVVESMLEDGAISQTEAEALFEQGQS